MFLDDTDELKDEKELAYQMESLNFLLSSILKINEEKNNEIVLY